MLRILNQNTRQEPPCLAQEHQFLLYNLGSWPDSPIVKRLWNNRELVRTVCAHFNLMHLNYTPSTNRVRAVSRCRLVTSKILFQSLFCIGFVLSYSYWGSNHCVFQIWVWICVPYLVLLRTFWHFSWIF